MTIPVLFRPSVDSLSYCELMIAFAMSRKKMTSLSFSHYLLAFHLLLKTRNLSVSPKSAGCTYPAGCHVELVLQNSIDKEQVLFLLLLLFIHFVSGIIAGKWSTVLTGKCSGFHGQHDLSPWGKKEYSWSLKIIWYRVEVESVCLNQAFVWLCNLESIPQLF